MKSVSKLVLATVLKLFLLSTVQAVQLDARISKTSVILGDSITFSIQLTDVTKKSKFIGPWTGNWPQPFVLLQSKPLIEDNKKWIWEGIFTIIDTGQVQLPSFDVLVIQGKDTTYLKTNPIPIEVKSTLIEKVKEQNLTLDSLLEKNKPPKSIPPSFWEWLLWLGIPLVAISLFLGIRKYLSYRKSLLPSPPPPPPPTPEEIVRRKLNVILKEAKWQLGDVKGFVTDLVNALKEYIDAKFELQTLESTTFELLDEKYKTILGLDEHETLIRMFYIADEVKFAKGNMANERCLEAIREAENLIEIWYQRKEMEKQNSLESSTVQTQVVEKMDESNIEKDTERLNHQ
ncbi:MAG: hypothetical protein N2450_03875 [bacterium]|nr:hypothetical protein [bacterium]